MSKHLRFFYIYLLLFSLNISFTSAQTNFASEDELKKEAAKLFEQEEYEKAAPLYSQLLSNYLKDANYNYRLGVCLLFTSEDKEQALRYLEFAASKPDIDKEVHYYLGRAYHLNYMFDEAIAEYHTYVKVASAKNVEKLQVHQQVEMCVNGKKLLNNLSDLVVLEKKEMNKEDFFRAYDITGIGGKLLVKPDEKEFKTSVDKKRKEQSIIYLAKDKSQIYFSSYGLDPINGKDIYVVKKMESGEWGKPQVLDNVVNTKYDEDSPFLHPNGKVLYFSSKGHNSMGGYDIFKSKFDETTNTWGVPENLDFPINTPDDDILYVTDSAEKEAYFSSARFSKSGKISVYHINVDRKPIELVIVKGNVKKNRNNQALDVKITVKNLATNTIHGIYNSSSVDGSYSLDLPNGGSFSFTVESAGFPTQSDVVVVPVQYKFKPMKQEISFDLVTGKMKIVSNFNETSENETYLLALNYIKSKSKMEVSIVDMTQLDTAKQETLTELAATNQPKTEDALTDKKLSNDDIVKIAYEDAKDVDAEAKEMREQADIALSLANQKNELAQNKVKEASSFMSEAQATADITKKEEFFDKSEAASTEAKQLNQETVIAFNLAKKLDANAFKKQEEADISQEYAKSLEASIKSGNSVVALAKVEEQEKKLEALSQANATSSSISSSLKAEADTKQRELDKAIGTTNDIKQEIVDNETVIGNLRSDLEKTKNEELKQGIINQIAELNQENSDKKVEIKHNEEKVAKLQKEYDGILNETALVNTVINQSKTESSETASANVATIDKNKLAQQVNNIETVNGGNKNEVAINSPKKNSDIASQGSPIVSVPKETNPVKSTDITTAKPVTETKVDSKPGLAEQEIKSKTDNPENPIKVTKTPALAIVKPSKAELQKDSVKLVIADNAGVNNNKTTLTEPTSVETTNATTTAKNNPLVPQVNATTVIPEVKTEAFAKNDPSVAVTKDEIKLDNSKTGTTAIASATTPSVSVVPPAVVVSNKTLGKQVVKNESEPITSPATETKPTAIDTKQESSETEKTVIASNTKTVSEDNLETFKALNSGAETNSLKTKDDSFAVINKKNETEYVEADKITDPIVRETAKTEVLQKWAKAIDEDIIKLQQEYDTASNESRKELIANQLNEARTNSNEKHTMANISRQSVEELKQQSTSLTTTDNSKQETKKEIQQPETNAAIPIASNKPKIPSVSKPVVPKPSAPIAANKVITPSTEKPVIPKPSVPVAVSQSTTTSVGKSIEPKASAPVAINQPVIQAPVVKKAETKQEITPDVNPTIAIVNTKPDVSSEKEQVKQASVETSITEGATKKNTVSDIAEANNQNTSSDKIQVPANLVNAETDKITIDTVDQTLAKINKTNSDDLAVVEKIKNKKDREIAKNAALKMWAEEIDAHVAKLQKEYWNATDSKKKSLLAIQIANAEKTSKEKYTPAPISQQSAVVGTTVSLGTDESFERKSFPVYSAEKPIPINNKLPEGLIYKVQIGAFRKPIPQDLFIGMTPITGETTPQGFIRYTAGIFKNYSTANNIKNQIKELGYKDAFVVAFLNGKRVSVKEASAISGEAIVSNSSTGNISIADLQKKFTDIASTVNTNTQNTKDSKKSPTSSESVKSVGGLFFTVQIGVFANNVPSSKLYNVQPLYTETAPNGNLRYNVGIYNNLSRAAEAKFMTIDVGLKDSYVTAYFNGKRISMKEATTQHELNGDKVFSTDPNINILPYFGSVKNNVILDKNKVDTLLSQNLNPKITSKQPTSFVSDSSTKIETSVKPEKKSDGIEGRIYASNFAPDVVFKIQLGAFRNEVPLEIVNQFLKISKLGVENHKDINGLTIYTAGDFKTYNEANNVKQEVIANNFNDAFVVAYRNGKKISMDEAKKSE